MAYIYVSVLLIFAIVFGVLPVAAIFTGIAWCFGGPFWLFAGLSGLSAAMLAILGFALLIRP